jgi:hypothetical protein
LRTRLDKSSFGADIDRPADGLGLSLFVLVSLLVGFAMRGLHRALRSERRHRTEAERALRRTSALESLTRALSKAQTPAEVTQASLSELLAAAGAAAGAVALVNNEGNQLDVAQAMGHRDPAAARYSVALASRTLLTEVVRRQSPLTFVSQEDRRGGFPDLSLDPMLEDGEGATSFLCSCRVARSESSR